LQQSAEFRQQFAVAVVAKQAALDKERLVQLRERLSSFGALYENVYNVLRRKGQIEDDPYKDADHATEVVIPSKDAYNDLERRVQLSSRFGQLHTQVEFIRTYYSFTTAFLDMHRGRLIGELVGYVNWSRLGEAADDFMTAELGRVVANVRAGNDSLSTGIVNDAVRQLAELTAQIIADLKELTAFHRQQYKLMLRTSVLDDVLADQDPTKPADIDRLTRNMKRRLAQSGAQQPFYPELAREVVDEELGAGMTAARKKTLDSLRVKRERTTATGDPTAARLSTLQEAIRATIGVAAHLQRALNKLIQNGLALQNRRKSLGERFRLWLARAVKSTTDPIVYDVDFKDPATGVVRSERIDFPEFVASLRRRVKVLAAASDASSQTYAKLQQSDEDTRLEFLDHNITQIRLLHRRAIGLGLHFAAVAGPEQKAAMNGIKIEMSGVKNGLLKATQFRNQYSAAREEHEQMLRLGIDGNSEGGAAAIQA
jgi:hypothetical protein